MGETCPLLVLWAPKCICMHLSRQQSSRWKQNSTQEDPGHGLWEQPEEEEPEEEEPNEVTASPQNVLIVWCPQTSSSRLLKVRVFRFFPSRPSTVEEGNNCIEWWIAVRLDTVLAFLCQYFNGRHERLAYLSFFPPSYLSPPTVHAWNRVVFKNQTSARLFPSRRWFVICLDLHWSRRTRIHLQLLPVGVGFHQLWHHHAHRSGSSSGPSVNDAVRTARCRTVRDQLFRRISLGFSLLIG